MKAHLLIGEGDTGLNTGGMGAVARLVLAHNHAQTLALVMARKQSLGMANVHARYIDDHNTFGAYAAATVLMGLALVTLLLMTALNRKREAA